MKKKCELCKNFASMYCDSDRASLCWDCDSRVHTANFLVAKHTRTLLCQACQSPTSWTGSGPKLGPTISVCDACIRSRNGKMEDDDMDDDDDDDDENQVVPLSPPPSLVTASAKSRECSSRTEGFSGSGFRFCGAKTTIYNCRFPYNTISRPEENNNGSQN